MSSPSNLAVVDELEAETLRQKVRSSKLILGALFTVFGCGSFATPLENTFRPLMCMITAISFYHLLFHFWCDCEDRSILFSRHRHHVYLVMLSNILLMFVLIPYDVVFSKAMGILVMPIGFTREAQTKQQAVMFIVIHATIAMFLLRDSFLSEGIHWLANLAIVDAMVVDVVGLRLLALELGSLLHAAYDCSQRATHTTVQRLLTNLSEAFVLVDEDATIVETSPTLSAMLSRSEDNAGMSFCDVVDYADRDGFRDHIKEWLTCDHEDAGENEKAVTTMSLKIDLLDGYGQAKPCLLFFAKLWGPSGDYIYYIAVCSAWQEKAQNKSSSVRKFRRQKGTSPAPSTETGKGCLKFLHPLASSIDADTDRAPTQRRRPSSPRPTPCRLVSYD